ncbi:endonuclease [Mesotoga sp. H07.pep.5.3]|nr:endonuclease [Mesotoga sp. H07.pep.5.3]
MAGLLSYNIYIMDYNKGDYIVLLFLREAAEVSSSKKKWHLESGYYLYVGSAMNSLTERVKRHLLEEKKKHWHIDFLREKAEVLAVLLLPTKTSKEEELSNLISNYCIAVPGFGASDCKTDSNLYRVGFGCIEKVFSSIVGKWRD